VYYDDHTLGTHLFCHRYHPWNSYTPPPPVTGKYSEHGLYSNFTNVLKQARRIQRDDSDEAHDEDGCNDDDDCWAEDCGLGVF